MSANAGYSYLGTVASAGIIGFVIDKFTGSAPWGLLGFLIVGFIYATYKAQMTMQNPPENSDEISVDNGGDKKETKKD